MLGVARPPRDPCPLPYLYSWSILVFLILWGQRLSAVPLRTSFAVAAAYRSGLVLLHTVRMTWRLCDAFPLGNTPCRSFLALWRLPPRRTISASSVRCMAWWTRSRAFPTALPGVPQAVGASRGLRARRPSSHAGAPGAGAGWPCPHGASGEASRPASGAPPGPLVRTQGRLPCRRTRCSRQSNG
jgi:hypothetical protein